jgi:hypothetical protein
MRVTAGALGLLVVLGGCDDFAAALAACEDAGRCPQAGLGDFDAGVDAGCDAPLFDGLTWVCPVTYDTPSVGNATLLNYAGAQDTADAFCVANGFVGASSFVGTGQRSCNGCYYLTGSVGYGFTVTWDNPFNSCNSCGHLSSVTCY